MSKSVSKKSRLPRRPSDPSRRIFLRGLGGVVVGLPLLEGLAPPNALARDASQVDSFGVFFRQPNGVAAEQNTDVGAEPERFWPRNLGALTAENVQGRALDEISGYLDRTLVLGNVNYRNYQYGDGHANGALQALTAQGPLAGTFGGEAEANGQSIDMLLARQLHSDQSDSLFLYAGSNGGWLGGPCIAYRGAGVRHSAVRNPAVAFANLFGGQQGDPNAATNATRRSAINDLIRGQMQSLMRSPRLSQFDQSRLSDHFDAIRDVEVEIACQRDSDEEALIQGGAETFQDPTGDALLQTVSLHGRVAALAVACGLKRSVVIQVGSGNGGALRFNDPDTQTLMENFHFISHRRQSHGSDGAIIADADLQHHKVDRAFGGMYRGILDAFNAFDMPDGTKLLDAGFCAWYNDNSNGPQHCSWDAPWVITGGIGGRLKQGEYLDVEPRTGGGPRCGRGPDDAAPNLNKLLNSLATELGAQSSSGGPLEDFGDPTTPGGRLPSILNG